MIRWITDTLGTAAFDSVKPVAQICIIDVRDLVDGDGNQAALIWEKIAAARDAMVAGRKVVVCCDYGVSRSNAMAAAVLAITQDVSFPEGLRQVIKNTGEKNIRIDTLNSIRCAYESRIKSNKGTVSEKSPRILITGGSGYIGTALRDKLGRVFHVETPGRDIIDLWQGPLDLDAMVKEKKITHILHLAHPRAFGRNQAVGEAVAMFKNILDVCKENGLKLVFLSSWEVYSGYRAERLLVSENTPLDPQGTVGLAKYLCEIMLEKYHMAYRIDHAVIRASRVYGGSADKPKFLYNFLNKAQKGEAITVHRFHNGHPLVDLIHLEDICEAIVAVFRKEFSGYIHIGSGAGCTTLELVEMIKDLVGSHSRVIGHDIKAYSPNIVMQVALANSALDWSPSIDLQAGLRTLATYPSNS